MIRALPLPDFGAWKGSEELARLAKRYIWWKTVDQAMENPEQIVAQVMNMGDWNDVCRLVDLIGDEGLCRVIKQAEIGMFNERSWHYWHYRLGLAKVGCVPALPVRKLSHDRSPFSPNKDILPSAQKKLWPELILFSLSRLLRREAASLGLVFGAKAFPTNGGAFLSIEPSVLAPIEAELVLHLRSLTV